MEPRAKDLLDSLTIPSYLREILLLEGVRCLQDMVEFDAEDIKNIEMRIKSQTFEKSLIEYDSKRCQLQYFGKQVSNFADFSFPSRDIEKMLKISAAAAEKITENSNKKASSRVEQSLNEAESHITKR